jgi:hypothetical protein
MSRRPKNHLLSSACLAGVVCITSAVLITRASMEKSTPATQAFTADTVKRGPGNFFSQPEALRVARRIGKRFGSSRRRTSVMTGTVTFGSSGQQVTITRRQLDTGENVEFFVASGKFTWRAEEGTRTGSGMPTDMQRLLSERLVYDSPDYFVLAQLRGASYLTVAQNVRPENAPDTYDGPLWTIVRVDDPQSNESARPKSSWRLYYINSQTGLIDRIVSQLNNETVEAQITQWTEESGEKTPSHINWLIGGQTIMSFQVASVYYDK